MDETPPNQSDAKEKRVAGFQFHLSTLLALVLLAPPLIWANARADRRPFQNAEVFAYGWPLPMLYVEVDHDRTKLDPPAQVNYVSLYYNLTVVVLILVCAGAFFQRRAQRSVQPAAGTDASPAVH